MTVFHSHPLLEKIVLAEQKIRSFVLQTPLHHSVPLSEITGAEVHLKMESEQYTNSFKIRGALNKIFSLSKEDRSKGVITSSTGNHAQGVAMSCMIAQCSGTIYLPKGVNSSKVEAIQRYPVEIVFGQGNALETELQAQNEAIVQGRPWISPYNDSDIIAGQGTIGVELKRQLANINNVLITVGGGGLISGIGLYMKAHFPDINIIGCQPTGSAAMYQCIRAGRILNVDHNETLSDGSAGDVEPGSITFPICQDFVDDYILVTEEEIKKAIQFMIEKHHKIVEGAAAVSVAGLLKQKEEFKASKTVVIICGANISSSALTKVLISK